MVLYCSAKPKGRHRLLELLTFGWTVQSQKAVIAYFSSMQLLCFARQCRSWPSELGQYGLKYSLGALVAVIKSSQPDFQLHVESLAMAHPSL